MRYALIGWLLMGCGARAASTPTPIEPTAIARWERSPVPSRSARLAAETARPGPPREVVRLERRAETFRGSGRRIDLRLERARLASALRLLAEAADVGIVLGEGLDDVVSVDLRRVRPVEAMQALAEAYGVELSMVGRTVVARR